MDKEKRLKQKRDYYQVNKEKILAQQKKQKDEKYSDPIKRKAYTEAVRMYNRNNYEARLLSAIKYKSKRYQIPFNLELTDIKIPEKCPKTGIPLVIHNEKGRFHDTPSIDRIIPSNGYVKGNIQITSLWYNLAKLDWEESLMVQMCKNVALSHG